MKRHTIAFLIGIGTFLLGLAVATAWYLNPSAESVTVQPIAVAAEPPAFVTCKETSTSFPGLSKPLESLKKYKGGYFPEKAFDDGWSGADGSFDDWYGKHLRAMGERSLLDIKDFDTETYRFLWLRTFHHPISVAIERTGYSFRLRSVELNGAGGYEPGRKLRTVDIEIFSEQWCGFTDLLDKGQFWTKPTIDRENLGNDGAQWILEGVNDGRYHIVDRWSPDNGSFREACIYLLKLSGRDDKSLGGELY